MFENLTSQRPPALSLNALRAFEAMARTGRATLAAEELRVTHSAVSRQVKALERRLGVALFAGPRHDLKLTEAGRELLEGLTPGFEAIDLAVLKAEAQARALIIAANPSISVKWLAPRLGAFAARRPRTRVELVELATHALAHRGAHAAVRILDETRLARQDALAFMTNYVGPVAAPALKPGAPRLISRSHPTGWDRWAGFAGEPIPPGETRQLPHLHVMIEAAVGGLGVAVLPWGLIAEEVRAGRLTPMGRFVRDGAFVVLADPRAETADVRAFKTWIVDEGARAAAEFPPPL